MRLAGFIAVGGGVAACIWMTQPPNRVVLDETCKPSDILAQISAAIHRDSFWRAQDAAVADALQQLAASPAAAERANNTASMSAIESRMTRLSSNETGSSTEQAEAEAREQRLRLNRMGWLVRCQGVISQHLAR